MRILNSLACSCAKVRRCGMSCITQDGDSRFAKGRKRRKFKESPLGGLGDVLVAMSDISRLMDEMDGG